MTKCGSTFMEVERQFCHGHVFLNLHEVDVTKTFVSQFGVALRPIGCDDLMRVRVHVAVFSPNYAECEYCLHELSDIIASGKPLIPVFYNVKAEDVQGPENEKGLYAEAFRKWRIKGRNDDVERWKGALMEAGAKAGFESAQYTSETKLLDEVVDAVRARNLAQHDIFLNHTGRNKDFVELLDTTLRQRGGNPFLDFGDHQNCLFGCSHLHPLNIIKDVLTGVKVLVAVFSPDYAESEYCLNDLVDMLACGKPLIPVFYNVGPEVVRYPEIEGLYAEAFRKWRIEGRNHDVERWKGALMKATEYGGLVYNDSKHRFISKTKAVEEIVKEIGRIEKLGKHDVFLNHRGKDVKSNFVSDLNEALRGVNCDPFLDAKSLVKGSHALNSIDYALASVEVHVAVFSPNYAESEYCLDELFDMLASRKPLIRVFFNVKPEDVQCPENKGGQYANAFRKWRIKGTDQDVERWIGALMKAGKNEVVEECIGALMKAGKKQVLERWIGALMEAGKNEDVEEWIGPLMKAMEAGKNQDVEEWIGAPMKAGDTTGFICRYYKFTDETELLNDIVKAVLNAKAGVAASNDFFFSYFGEWPEGPVAVGGPGEDQPSLVPSDGDEGSSNCSSPRSSDSRSTGFRPCSRRRRLFCSALRLLFCSAAAASALLLILTLSARFAF